MKLFFTDNPDCGVKGIYFKPHTTLEKYEAKRNIKPTIFRPSWLSEYSKCYTVRTIKDSNRVVTTQRVHTHLFDEIIKMKVENGDIHCVGLIKEKQTFLILRK